MRFRRIARRRRRNRPRGCERLTGSRCGQVFVSGMKAVQRGVYSAHRGGCGLPGYGRSARTKSMSGAKTAQRGVYSVHRGKCRPWGRGQPTDDRYRQVFASGMKAVQRGVYSVPRGKYRPSGHKRSAQASFRIRDETVHGRRRRQMAAATSFRVRDENRSERRSLGF